MAHPMRVRATSANEMLRAPVSRCLSCPSMPSHGTSATRARSAQAPSPARQLSNESEIGTVSRNAEVSPIANAVV